MREGERIDGLHLRKACMKRIVEFFRSITAIQKGYFSEFCREIAVRNLQLMRTAGYAGIILYVVYFVITQLYFKEKAISPLYGLIVPVLASFSLYATRALARGKINMPQAQRATLLHYFTLMLYIMIMSVFPHPEVPFRVLPALPRDGAGALHTARLPAADHDPFEPGAVFPAGAHLQSPRMLVPRAF